MAILKESIRQALHGDINQFYQGAEGIIKSRFNTLVSQGRRGEARILLDEMEPGIKALEISGNLPPYFRKESMSDLRRKARRSPQRRRGHSKRWSPK